MFCPYCGASLLPADHNEFRCQTSGAFFSQHLSARFRQDFPGVPAPERVPLADAPSCWFCPGCGVPMAQIADFSSCPQCAGSLTRSLLREIIEFNPHIPSPKQALQRTATGGWLSRVLRALLRR